MANMRKYIYNGLKEGDVDIYYLKVRHDGNLKKFDTFYVKGKGDVKPLCKHVEVVMDNESPKGRCKYRIWDCEKEPPKMQEADYEDINGRLHIKGNPYIVIYTEDKVTWIGVWIWPAYHWLKVVPKGHIVSEEDSPSDEGTKPHYHLDIPGVLEKNTAMESPGNDQVILDWSINYERENTLTVVGNVTAKDTTEVIDLVIVAFTSPDYRSGHGRYYTGSLASVFDPPPPPGATTAFILQSQQFTKEDQGKTVAVRLQGYVNGNLFSFTETITIPTA